MGHGYVITGTNQTPSDWGKFYQNKEQAFSDAAATMFIKTITLDPRPFSAGGHTISGTCERTIDFPYAASSCRVYNMSTGSNPNTPLIRVHLGHVQDLFHVSASSHVFDETGSVNVISGGFYMPLYGFMDFVDLDVAMRRISISLANTNILNTSGSATIVARLTPFLTGAAPIHGGSGTFA